MKSTQKDLLELSEYVWRRFIINMEDTDDEEWRWMPVANMSTSICERVSHSAIMLAERKNAVWLGVPYIDYKNALPSDSVKDALAKADGAFAIWRQYLDQLDDKSLGQTIGKVAGPYENATRFSFVLHILDELIYDMAQVTLLRELYKNR